MVSAMTRNERRQSISKFTETSIIAIIHFATSETVRKDVVPSLRMMMRRDWPTRCNAGRKSPRVFRASHDRCRKREGRDLITKTRGGNHDSQWDIASGCARFGQGVDRRETEVS